MNGQTARRLKIIENDRSCDLIQYGLNNILGSSTPLKRVINQAKAAGRSNAHVLIQGESGTGKEMIAQAIHGMSRPDGPFIAVNCGALPGNLVESELFGYQAGAFTGADRRGMSGKIEMAHEGTLFLDEIGDMPLSMQPVLLRVIEEKRVMRLGSGRYIPLDFRVVAASNQNIYSMVREQMFREDLYYRLSAFKMSLPPLKERGEDIITLAHHYVNRACAEMQLDVMEISEQTLDLMMTYEWPGNIRQLANAMMYAVSMAQNGVINVDDLPEDIIDPPIFSDEKEPKGILTMRECEKKAIQRAMIYCDNNVIKAAEVLGISRTTLYRKIKEYDIY